MWWIIGGAIALYLLSKSSGPSGGVVYYNKAGQIYRAGESDSYWWNPADRTWYHGTLDGKIEAVATPPFPTK